MARDRANINTAIWTDDDWRELTHGEQWLYKLLLTHPSLSYAGVCDWRPGRLAQNSSDTTSADIERIGSLLQSKRFIFIDQDTEEVVIRSFLRHDGLLKQPKLGVSMANAYGSVASKMVRKVIIHELKRIREEHPEWRAFTVEAVADLLKLEGCDMSTFTPGFTPPLTPAVTPTADHAQALPTATATTTATPPEGGGSGGRRSPERPLPEGWAPNSAHKDMAKTKGLDLDTEAETFKNHAMANDRRLRDWNAGFRMWLTKSKNFNNDRSTDPWAALRQSSTQN